MFSGLWFVGRHVRGLCVKTWAASPPIASARSIAVWIPPARDNGRRTAPRYHSAACPPAPFASQAPSPTGLPPHRRRPDRRSSTGSSRATRAASSCSADREHGPSREVEESVDQIQRSLAGSGSTGTARRRSSSTAWSAHQEVARHSSSEGHGLRGRGRDPVPHAGRGDDRVGRRGQGPDRVPEREARGRRAPPFGRPADLQLRLARGRLGRRDHARGPRRGPRLEHPEADLGSSRRSAPTRRATRTFRTSSGRTGASSRSATAPSRSRSSAPPATCPRRS